MIAFFKQLVPTKMALEACGGAHYWARELTALGHEVRLIPPNTSNPLSNAARMTATTPRQSVKRRVGQACISCR
jgi:transposase